MILSLYRQNKLPGIGQMFRYTLRDESNHIEVFRRLLLDLVEENREIWTAELPGRAARAHGRGRRAREGVHPRLPAGERASASRARSSRDTSTTSPTGASRASASRRSPGRQEPAAVARRNDGHQEGAELLRGSRHRIPEGVLPRARRDDELVRSGRPCSSTSPRSCGDLELKRAAAAAAAASRPAPSTSSAALAEPRRPTASTWSRARRRTARGPRASRRRARPRGGRRRRWRRSPLARGEARTRR